ncbi:trypco2 family protein [Kitasatospora sp. NPDC059673]|uniref:trypco2 family protein n=1 Tax=Kitasatospora sp. NPDC059673 TaxID=3346901 RepID=UPI0036CB23CF
MTGQQENVPQEPLPLSEMVAALRQELKSAQEKAAGDKLQFGVSGVEVEATVQVSNKGTGKGGVQFWVLQAGGEYEHGNVATHRIKLSLTVPDDMRIASEDQAQ